jgi:hypothetical protein
VIHPEVEVKPLSAKLERFDKPIRMGAGKRMLEYQEALVLQLQVEREQFDSLPPNIAPFLYIGGHEYRVFRIERRDGRTELMLTFHIRNWEKLEEEAPIVLTIDHGAPIREPERFMRREGPRFSKSMIQDTR